MLKHFKSIMTYDKKLNLDTTAHNYIICFLLDKFKKIILLDFF